jgi:hypothetical protein
VAVGHDKFLLTIVTTLAGVFYMMNKKILAASIAAAFTFNAHAVIDLDRSASANVYASEAVTAAAKTIATSTELDLRFNVGQNLAITGSLDPLVRVALTNATFTAIVDEGDFGLTLASASTTPFAQGGAHAGTIAFAEVSDGGVGGSFVVVSLENSAATLTSNEITVDLSGATSGLLVTDVTKPVTVTYSLYASTDTTAALNGNGTPLYTTSLDIATFASGQNRAGSAESTKNTALVAKLFKEFGATAAGTTTGIVPAGKVAGLGRLQLAAVAGTTGILNAASTAVTAGDVYTASSKATVTGDFSVGTYHMSALNTCATASATANALVVNTAMTSATVAALDYVAGQTLCVTVDGATVVPRNADGYTITLDENDKLAGTVGSIVYDTTAITIPYVTTFSDYNQRVYILNNGASEAKYTTTFQTETGTTATAGTAATGTVPANTLMVIKAADMVSFEGTTRGAAVVEIEASTSNIEATTQTINVSDSSTDTVVLEVTGS